MAQLLDVNKDMASQLADVKNWQRQLQVNLRDTDAGLNEYKQVCHNSAIRSASSSA